MISVRILATGSSGNCVLVNGHILIDAGITFKHFCEFGVPLGDITHCIITHKHGDHMNKPFVRKLITSGIPVIMSEDSAGDLSMEGKIDVENCVTKREIQFLHKDQLYGFGGGLFMQAYPQRHHDIINYALVFHDADMRALYSTDLDSIEPTDVGEGLINLGMFDIIMLEGNYDELYLRSYIEYMISIVPEAENPETMDNEHLERWVKKNYRVLPDEVARNAFRAIQNHRHLSKQQARAYAATHLKKDGKYYEIHRSSTFYEEPVGWKDKAE